MKNTEHYQCYAVNIHYRLLLLINVINNGLKSFDMTELYFDNNGKKKKINTGY